MGVGVIAGFGVGWTVGFSMAINMAVDLAIQYTDISVDPEILKQLILRYG